MTDLIRRTVGPEISVETVDMVGLWQAMVDPPQLENALLNLCINARDAMPDGGRITIETANRWMDDRTARERDVAPGQYLSLCVSDTGTGMSPDVIARAFDPFFTTKPLGQGTGLSLSMIYGFARQSGGQVRIYSEVGQGTMVCIYLPRHRGEAGDPGQEADRHGDVPRAIEGETVLIVDDEPTVRMLVADVLGDLGYSALEAEDGASGLSILQSRARIDLLITDVGLPNGMNGRQVADAARVIRPGLKVLFITGYAENAVIGNGQLDPGMAVLTKPFAMDDLAGQDPRPDRALRARGAIQSARVSGVVRAGASDRAGGIGGECGRAPAGESLTIAGNTLDVRRFSVSDARWQPINAAARDRPQMAEATTRIRCDRPSAAMAADRPTAMLLGLAPTDCGRWWGVQSRQTSSPEARVPSYTGNSREMHGCGTFKREPIADVVVVTSA